MRVDVRSFRFQCETCGVPIDVCEATAVPASILGTTTVVAEPCGHTVDLRTYDLAHTKNESGVPEFGEAMSREWHRESAGKSEAPSFDCAACGRTIGRTKGHHLTDDDRVVCNTCVTKRTLHRKMWPECEDAWHDVWDHLKNVSSTRAGVASLLGLWP